MSQLDKIKNTFYREGYKSVDQLRRVELDSFLNAIIVFASLPSKENPLMPTLQLRFGKRLPTETPRPAFKI